MKTEITKNNLPEIKNMADVVLFIKFCTLDLDLNFNPDTYFSEYINNMGDPVFTHHEVKLLADRLTDCMHVCDESCVDIYEVSLQELHRKQWGVK